MIRMYKTISIVEITEKNRALALEKHVLFLDHEVSMKMNAKEHLY
jgi:hypothetical protein